MSAVNSTWAQSGFNPAMRIDSSGNMGIGASAAYRDTTYGFTVEKVDNGFVLRSGDKVKIAKDIEELKDLFVQTLVEHRMGD